MTVRRCIAVALAAAMAIAALAVSDAHAQPPQRSSMFCGFDLSDAEARKQLGTPRLYPRDEAARDPEFAAFLRELMGAVKRRDVDAILRVTDPGFRLDFGGSDGIEYLKRELARPDTDFWIEFPRAIALGATFTQFGFAAPYVFSEWPDGFDSFECAAIIGSGVRLRARPGLSSPVVTMLAYDIVATMGPYEESGWTHVQTAAGRTGFVSSNYVRSPIDYRAIFQKKNGRWWLTAFLAGD